jgi:hypothetical protein
MQLSWQRSIYLFKHKELSLLSMPRYFNKLEMRSFTLLLVFVSLGSFLTARRLVLPQPNEQVYLPEVIRNYHFDIKDSFKKRENANLLIMYITGTKEKISHHTNKNWREAHLTHLLSPGGLHLSVIIAVLFYFFKRRKKQKTSFHKKGEILFLCLLLLLDGFLSLKRLAVFRLIVIGKKQFHLPLPIEWILFIVFLWALAVGHFQHSPLGFLYSFSYLGTFIFLRHEPRMRLILGIFLIELIMSLFLSHRLSFLAILFNFFFIFLFELLFILSLIFYMSFWIFKWNFIEPLIQSFKWLVDSSLFISNISLTTSSPFLLMAILLIFYWPQRLKSWVFIICLYLHSNTSLGPTIILSHTLTKGDNISKR